MRRLKPADSWTPKLRMRSFGNNDMAAFWKGARRFKRIIFCHSLVRGFSGMYVSDESIFQYTEFYNIEPVKDSDKIYFTDVLKY